MTWVQSQSPHKSRRRELCKVVLWAPHLCQGICPRPHACARTHTQINTSLLDKSIILLVSVRWYHDTEDNPTTFFLEGRIFICSIQVRAHGGHPCLIDSPPSPLTTPISETSKVRLGRCLLEWGIEHRIVCGPVWALSLLLSGTQIWQWIFEQCLRTLL